MPSSDWALILCCRYPHSGGVKTRLAKSVGANGAAELYAAFLRDTLAWASAPQPFDLLVSLADGRHCGRFSEDFGIQPDTIFAQSGNDLGARFRFSFEEVFKRNYQRVALAASDAPELCLADVQAALNALEEYDVVLAPAPDGGWSLMALRRLVDVFSGVTWSTSVVLNQTLDLARASNKRVFLLRPVADIDEVEDLEAFCTRLAESPELRQRLPHTARRLLVGERRHPLDRR
jgi:rSAM/selenodomain-associated transferase 1